MSYVRISRKRTLSDFVVHSEVWEFLARRARAFSNEIKGGYRMQPGICHLGPLGSLILRTLGRLVLGCIERDVCKANTHFATLFKIYKICTFLHRTNPRNSAKSHFVQKQTDNSSRIDFPNYKFCKYCVKN